MNPALIVMAAAVALAQQSPDQNLFNTEILPVVSKACAGCHDGTKAQSDLVVTSLDGLIKGGRRGAAIVPGSASASLLIQYIKGDRGPRMPLGGAPLNAAAMDRLARAINALAPRAATPASGREQHLAWLLKAPRRPATPAVSGSSWVRNPIDAFVLSRLESAGMRPAPPASPRALLRRLYFGLIGLPPTPAEARAFLEDRSADAYERLVDRLLADPRYGARWARHWLDLARYAESDGFAIDGERPAAWRYRDYVIRSFNANKPYDEFVKEQLAGDEAGGGPERLVAMGFLRMSTWEADANSKQQLRQDFLNEVTGTTSAVFLGLTAGCAQCHDHKYDPIPQRDFYRLQAFFAATAIEESNAPFIPAEDPGEMRRRFRRYEDALETATAGLDQRREALKQRFMAIRKVKEDHQTVKDFLRDLGVRNAFFQERDKDILDQGEWKSYREAKDQVDELTETVRRYRPVAYTVRDVTPPQVPAIHDTYVLQSGELAAKAEKVEPGFLESIAGHRNPAVIPFKGGSSGRRTALAEWISSAENPLTARVMANRVWQHHFGEGIVRTPSDFGINGERPTHPELLDWLAAEFVARKWSVKDLHRLILTSNTWRQSVENEQAPRYATDDPGNRLLWRQNWQRLDSEVLRDTLLSLSGRLNAAQGGPGALFEVPADVAEGFEFFKWFPSPAAEQNRRSIYTFQRRSVVDPLMETFDVANNSGTCARRIPTVVAPQALTLMNGDLANLAARHFAGRVTGGSPGESIRNAFGGRRCRDPSPAELDRAQTLLARDTSGLRHLAVVLFNLNEFLYLE